MLFQLDWLPLAVKIVSTAAVVIAASMASERAGPFWGALFSTLPVYAGPSYVMLSIERGSHFVADSALEAFAMLSASGLFLLTLCRTSPRLNRFASLAVALAVWIASAWAIHSFAWTALSATVLNLAVYLVCFALTIRPWRESFAAIAVPRHWYDLPLRAGAVAVMVIGVVGASSVIGASATGIGTMFPISLAVLTIVVHSRLGGRAMSLVAASALRTIIGLGLAVLCLSLAAPAWGSTAALIAALFCSLAWTGGVITWRVRVGRAAAA